MNNFNQTRAAFMCRCSFKAKHPLTIKQNDINDIECKTFQLNCRKQLE